GPRRRPRPASAPPRSPRPAPPRATARRGCGAAGRRDRDRGCQQSSPPIVPPPSTPPTTRPPGWLRSVHDIGTGGTWRAVRSVGRGRADRAHAVRGLGHPRPRLPPVGAGAPAALGGRDRAVAAGGAHRPPDGGGAGALAVPGAGGTDRVRTAPHLAVRPAVAGCPGQRRGVLRAPRGRAAGRADPQDPTSPAPGAGGAGVAAAE